jgi:hypothetical protein
MDERGVTFRWKDYRVKDGAKGKTHHQAMTLAPEEFMRRFLQHVLPDGFHCIRHYGLLANGNRKQALAAVRDLLTSAARDQPHARTDDSGSVGSAEPKKPSFVSHHCGQPLTILQTLAREQSIRAPPTPCAGGP